MKLHPRIAGLLRRPGDATVDVARNVACSRFEVDGWQLSDFVCRRLVPRVGVRPFPLHELLLMTAAVCRLKPPLIFEWGTHVGKSARVFHETLSAFRIPSHVHSIDLPVHVEHGEHPGARRGELVRGLRGVTLHQGDGLQVALGLWAASGRPRAPLFFLDGDHRYESVLREIDGVIDAVPDASLLLHDTFYQSSGSAYNVGPHRAVHETIERFPERWECLHTGLCLPGMTLLIPQAR
jgi:cephalosporin hydroxylase